MKNLKLNLKCKSGFSNLFTADQIWGQMVCAIGEMKGDDEASKFVEEFKANPPFLISNMLPEGFLPRPVLPPFKRDNNEKISVKEEQEFRLLAKSNKKKNWIPIDVFIKNQKNINQLKLAKIGDNQPEIIKINEVRSSIDRHTGAPFERGGVFNQTFLFSDNNFVIYLQMLREEEKWSNILDEIVDYFNIVGLGGDRNVGKGNFNILIEELDSIEKKLFEYREGDFYMTLSRCSGEDLNPLYYQMKYYFGIVGSNISDKKTFNKYPVVYFEPGSIFKKGNGSILENVHTDSRICSYGYSFPLYLSS